MDFTEPPMQSLECFFMLSNDVFIPLIVYSAKTKTKQGEKDSRH